MTQVPAPLQVLMPLQSLPSSQLVPAGAVHDPPGSLQKF